jgi:hypothetical protein
LAAGGFPRLAAARRATPFMLKLTDFDLLAAGAVVLGLDSDLLFFGRPDEVLERCARPGSGYLVQTDPETAYNVTAEVARQAFGVALVPRVNTGFLVFARGLPDWRAFERYLAHPDVARPTGFIEQTLFALHGSEVGGLDLLPEHRYPIDLRAGLPYEGVVARHYAGRSRPLLTSEGMPRVLEAAWFQGARGRKP